MNILSQKCIKCEQELTLDNFHKNIRTGNGYHYQCKACTKVYQLSIKDKLKTYQHEYQKQYRIDNKEALHQRIKEWKRNNPEKCRASVKKSNAKRKDKLREYYKQYRLRKKLEKQQNEQ